MDEMSVNARILELRKSLHLSRDAFGAKIGVSGHVVRNWDRNETNAAEKPLIIGIICKEYGINREWLEHGTGEMYDANALSVIDQLAKRYKLSDTARKVLETYIGLDENDKQVIDRFVRKIVESHQANQPINLKESMVYTVKVAARGGEPPHTEEMTQAEAERIANLPRVPDDL